MLSTTAALNQQEDFPVGFAEIKETSDDTVFYVEWFDNSSEFPSLSTSNDHNLTSGAWELLQRKEINEDEHTLVPVEGDAWSKLSTPDSKELYADVAEKHAELKPTKRTVKPLWPNMDVKKKTIEKEPATTTEDLEDQYDLGDELITNRKTESRRSNQLASRRKLHDLRTVDIHVEGIVRLATTRFGKTNITWVPYEKKPSSLDVEEQKVIGDYFDVFNNSKILSKPAVLRYSSRFSHNVKEYAYKYTQRPAFRQAMVPDNCEFSALAKITSK